MSTPDDTCILISMFRDFALRAHGFEGDIEHDAATLEENSRDASLFCVRPQVVVYPKHVHDVQALVRYVSHERENGNTTLSLTARAAGTDMSGGPLSDSIVVSMTRYFDKIHAITTTEHGGSVVVEPGVYYRFLEQVLTEKGLLFPSFPASKDICTIGGIVANNSAGEKTLTYGQTIDYVEEIHMVCDDGLEHVFRPISPESWERKMEQNTHEGKIYSRLHTLLNEHADSIQKARPRVSKNATGYALWRVPPHTRADGSKIKTYDITALITGSQGTLGIITKVKLRLVRPQPISHLVVTMLPSLADIPTLVETTLKYNPETLESYDDHTFRIAMKFLPDIIRRMKGTLFSLSWRFLPEAWMILTGGVPKVVALAEFTGTDENEVHARAAKAEFELRAKGFSSRRITSPSEARKYWTFRHESFQLLRSKVRGMRTACFVDDIVVPPRTLPNVLPKVYELLDKYSFLYTIQGHIGDGNFHIIPLVDPATPHLVQSIRSCMREICTLVFSVGGSMSGEHNDGLIRTSLLPEMYGEEIVHLFNDVKDIFDPHHMFNPRKKAYGDEAWSWQHVDLPQ